jgi:hypothetical protein
MRIDRDIAELMLTTGISQADGVAERLNAP